MKNTRSRPSRRRTTAGIAACGALVLTGMARADVEVRETVTVTEVIQPALGQPIPNGKTPQRQESAHSPITVTTDYKGGSARTEIEGGLITLYDGSAGKVYTIDPAQKTYDVRSLKDAQEPRDTGNRPMKTDVSLDVHPGDGAQTFLGFPSKVFVVSGTITVTPERSGPGERRGGPGGGRRRGHGGGGFPGGGGGFPGGGGGFPGGGFPMLRADDAPDSSSSGVDPNVGYGGSGPTKMIEVSGEFWLSDAVKLPNDKKATLLPAMSQAVSQGDSVLKALTDNLNKQKEIPLKSRITLTHSVPATGAQDSVTTTTELTAVSQSPLSDSLFQLPLGYTQVAPPATPVPSPDGDSVP